MAVIVGDIWKVQLARDWLVIPTNQGWRHDGTNVMGRGIAAHAARTFTDLPLWYGALCRQHGAQLPVLAHPGHRLILFPTKPLLASKPWESWKLGASLDLVRQSCTQLVSLIPLLPWRGGRILLPAVGCGNGGLNPAEIVPELMGLHKHTPEIQLVLDPATSRRVPCRACGGVPVQPVCTTCLGSGTMYPNRLPVDLAAATWEVVGADAAPSFKPPDMPPQAPIDDFRGPNRWLSNFHPVDVALDGVVYPSTEHAYQAAKFPVGSKHREVIRQAPRPKDAKKLGRMPGARADWDIVRRLVMLDVLRQKFTRGTALASALQATGDRELVEGNTWHDCYWGRCRCETCGSRGENQLGQLLMQVRSELRS